MASIINAATSGGLITTADTSGILQLQTAGTTAVTVDASQNVTFVGSQTLSGGTANGVTYLNGSKVLTSGSALTFDGTNLGVGAAIGTTSLSNQRLLITGTAEGATTYGMYVHNDSFSAGRARISMSPRYSFAYNTAPYIESISDSTSAASLIFGYTTSSTATEGMRLTSTGLGIGTSTVTGGYKAQINGNLLLSSTTPLVVGNSTLTLLGDNTSSTGLLINTSGNLGLGVTPSAWTRPAIQGGASGTVFYYSATSTVTVSANLFYGGSNKYIGNGAATQYYQDSGVHVWENAASGTAGAGASMTERMRIDTSGNLLVAGTNSTPATSNVVGFSARAIGLTEISVNGNPVLYCNRKTDDGTIVGFYQDGTQEGSISVSGTTVSYNGGHLSRYAQTTAPKDDSIFKGTVLSNLDEMNVYTKDGQPVDNEQLNKVKVSDTEGDVNVAGVFVNWSHDEQHNVDEINMAMTGDMIIRIAQGVTVVRGDLLMSAGDGTAKPQGDDIVRSKTVAKVTSNHITCTYADGSYCIPCVLMAC